MNYNNHLIGICRVAPLPKVAKSIRREIEANRLTASDIRFRSLAANMAIERPRRRVGLNDGVFYPEEFVPEGLMRMAARRPTHLCAWSKAHLGWLKPKNITAAKTIELAPVESKKVTYRLWTDGQSGQEYFLLENRQAQAGWRPPLRGLYFGSALRRHLVSLANSWLPHNLNPAFILFGISNGDVQMNFSRYRARCMKGTE